MIVVELVLHWLGNIMILLGAFFVLTGAVGLLRMPDFFSRLHPAGVADSMGVSFVLLGLMLHAGLTLMTVKLLMVMLFVLLTSPTACHALAKAAFLSGMADEEFQALKEAEEGETIRNVRARTGEHTRKGTKG